MRKLALAGLLAAALGGSAWADDAQEKRAEAEADLQKEKAEANKDVQKAQAEAQKDTAEAQAKAGEKVGEAEKDAQEKKHDAAQEGTAAGGDTGMRDDVRRTNEAGDNARAVNQGTGMGMGSDKHPVFTKDNWDVEGKVQTASASSITVTREDLPAAKLNIDKNTKVELDGNKVSAAQLMPGQEVKASFNLQNDKPMAVEIKAEKD
jgi:membrane protein involved in colicin uptake